MGKIVILPCVSKRKSYTLYAKEPPAPRKYGAINTEEETDLQGAFSGSDRVFRGGSWDNFRMIVLFLTVTTSILTTVAASLVFGWCVPVLNKTTCCVKEQPKGCEKSSKYNGARKGAV